MIEQWIIGEIPDFLPWVIDEISDFWQRPTDKFRYIFPLLIEVEFLTRMIDEIRDISQQIIYKICINFFQRPFGEIWDFIERLIHNFHLHSTTIDEIRDFFHRLIPEIREFFPRMIEEIEDFFFFF